MRVFPGASDKKPVASAAAHASLASSRSWRVLLGVATAVFAMLYPVAIWVGLSFFSARAVGLWILALLLPAVLFRFRRARRADIRVVLRIPLVIALVVVPGVVLDDPRFVLAMPALINLALLVTFAATLRGTPMVERFARLQEPEGLSADQVRHCRQVTWAWVGFFALNGVTAAALAAAAPLSWWAAYNGGLAYGLMGAMFAGEYVLRQYRFRRYGASLHDRLLSRIFPPAEPERRREC